VTGALTWALVISALGVVVVRRRSVALALIGLQSAWLGVHAISVASGQSTALLVAGAVLLAKAVLLPAGLAFVVLRTREAQWIASERHPLARLTLALAVALPIAALVPHFGLLHPGVERAAVGLVALGITTAVVRRPAIFQVLGFLVAENGLYLAALSAPGGLPAFIELGLVFDLVVIVSVAGVFSAKIHEELGTGDTSLLGGLRD
jgi:hydrogenase-4 component E